MTVLKGSKFNYSLQQGNPSSHWQFQRLFIFQKLPSGILFDDITPEDICKIKFWQTGKFRLSRRKTIDQLIEKWFQRIQLNFCRTLIQKKTLFDNIYANNIFVFSIRTEHDLLRKNFWPIIFFSDETTPTKFLFNWSSNAIIFNIHLNNFVLNYASSFNLYVQE